MKKMQKIALTAAAFVGMATLGAGALYAAEDTRGEIRPMSHLVTAISQRFNLNEADVQMVFDEEHIKMREEMAGKMAEKQQERLSDAVSKGKLTQSQADAIIAKQKEMAVLFESLEGKSMEEVRTVMEAHKEATQQWAEENNIPQEYLRVFVHGGKGHGNKHFIFKTHGPMGPGFDEAFNR